MDNRFPVISSRNSYKAEFDYHMQFTQFLDSAIFQTIMPLRPVKKLGELFYVWKK